SVAAAVATLDRLTRVDAPQALAVRGAEIEAETLALFARYGVERLFSLNGDPCWSVVTGARPGLNDALAAALHARGVLRFGAHVPSLATEDRDIAHLLHAYAGALPTLAERFAAWVWTPWHRRRTSWRSAPRDWAVRARGCRLTSWSAPCCRRPRKAASGWSTPLRPKANA